MVPQLGLNECNAHLAHLGIESGIHSCNLNTTPYIIKFKLIVGVASISLTQFCMKCLNIALGKNKVFTVTNKRDKYGDALTP